MGGIASKQWDSFMKHKQNESQVNLFLRKWSFHIHFDAAIEIQTPEII